MIQEILANHEVSLFDTPHVYYNFSGENKGLFVSFAGAVDRYVGVSWFYRDTDFGLHCLFLMDSPPYSTYSDERFVRLIRHYVALLGVERLVFYGPSMGGVAALYHGLELRADLVIAVDPEPVAFDVQLLTGRVDGLLGQDWAPRLYLNYTFTKDWEIPAHTRALIDALTHRNCIVTIHPYRDTRHLAFIPSKRYIAELIRSCPKVEKSEKGWF